MWQKLAQLGGGGETELSFVTAQHSSRSGQEFTVTIDTTKNYILSHTVHVDSNQTFSFMCVFYISNGVVGEPLHDGTGGSGSIPTVTLSDSTLTIKNNNGSHHSSYILCELS